MAFQFELCKYGSLISLESGGGKRGFAIRKLGGAKYMNNMLDGV